MDNNKKILGLQHSVGEFNGRKFDNYVFFIGFEFPGDNSVTDGVGLIFTDRVKISAEQTVKLCERYDFLNPVDFIGCGVDEVYYNQYRQAVSFLLL